MMLKPVAPKPLSHQVFAQLQEAILSGEYQPGDRLPSERLLCEQLGVNRSSIREALKRLEQARLIRVRQGEGYVVLDYKEHAGFALLQDLVMPAGRLDMVALRSIFEFRTLIGPEIARLAALRIQESELVALTDIVDQIDACPPEDLERIQDLDFAFHHLMARAGENLALLLILNSVKEVYFRQRGFFYFLEPPESGWRGYRKILDAIGDGDAELARQRCADMIAAGNRNFWSKIPGGEPA